MQPKAQVKKKTERFSRSQSRILFISEETDPSFLSALESAGLKIVGVCDAAATPVALRRTRPQIVIASLTTKGLMTHELARMLSQTQDAVPLILTGPKPATLNLRLEVMSIGAFDYFQIPEEMELLKVRARQLVTLRQTIDQLRGEADLDPLTGLANRRRFRGALSREVERWHRYGAPCALLLLDIDHMKLINDTHGHPAGDLVLRGIADTLSKVSRDNDTAARVGGEEFTLLLAGIGATKAEQAAKRLLRILAEQHIEGVGNITVSIGVAACPENASSERTLYAASDQALYVAKNGGRNQVAVAPPMQEKLPGV